MSTNKKVWRWRAFISVLLMIMLAIVVVSGVVLYLSPRGRVANWTGWTMLGLSKDQWSGLHTNLGFLLFVFSLVHLLINWRPFVSYFSRAGATLVGFRKEVLASLVVAGIIGYLTVSASLPVVLVQDWGEQIKDSWEKARTTALPPHSEEQTLDDFAVTVGMLATELRSRIVDQGFVIPEGEITFRELAENHGFSPAAFFKKIAPANIVSPTQSNRNRSNQNSARQGGGGGSRGVGAQGGYGQMTIREVAAEIGIETEAALDLLYNLGIEVGLDDYVRDVAAENQVKPRDIVDLLRP